MKKSLRFIVFLALLLPLSNCVNDDNLPDPEDQMSSSQEEELPNTLEQISFDQFQENEAPEALSALKPFIDSEENGKSSNKSNKDKFTIHTDNIKKLTYDGKVSYTFFVDTNKDKSGAFENLVVEKTEDELSYFRIRYIPRENDTLVPYEASFQELEEDGLDADFVTGLKKNTNSSAKGGCPAVYYLRCSVGGDANGHSPQPQSNGSYCSGSPTVYDFSSCNGGGGGGGGDEDSPYESESPTNGAGGGGGSSPGPRPSGPESSPDDRKDLESTKEMVAHNTNRIKNLGLNLKEYQVSFLLRNVFLISRLESYLKKSNSSSTRAFAKTAIDAMIRNAIVDLEEHIIVERELAKDYPCQAGVILDASTACSPLTNLILDIFEKNNDVDMIFRSTASISSNGQTSNNIKYDVSSKTCEVGVSFNKNYLSKATDLSIARTAIHESLHAVLVYMLFEGKFVTKTGNPYAGYGELMDGYVNYLKTNNPTKYGNAQHEVIANLNRDIASSLSMYGKSKRYSLPFSYYETLSWGGLMQTESFKSKYPKYLKDGTLNPAWKTINNTLAAEQDNSSSFVDGTGKKITPKGKRCY